MIYQHYIRLTLTAVLCPHQQHIYRWDEGVIGMQIGEIAKIHCSPDYAYGAGGFPAWGIMPNSELVFEIEVLSVK